MRPIKRLKDFRLFARGHTGAAIEHADMNRVFGEVTVDLDLFPVGAVLLGVREEVYENLRERVVVTAHRIRRRRRLPAGRESLLAQMQFVAFPRTRDYFVQVERMEIVTFLLPF